MVIFYFPRFIWNVLNFAIPIIFDILKNLYIWDFIILLRNLWPWLILLVIFSNFFIFFMEIIVSIFQFLNFLLLFFQLFLLRRYNFLIGWFLSRFLFGQNLRRDYIFLLFQGDLRNWTWIQRYFVDFLSSFWIVQYFLLSCIFNLLLS